MQYKILLFALNIWIWVFIAAHAKAETIKFKEEELARESVLPVFDHPTAVKRRLVPLTERFQIGLGFGATFNDPWNNTFPINGNLFYHFNEIHALGIVVDYHIAQQTQYVSSVLNSSASSLAQQIPFRDSPYLKYDIFGVYEFTPYYGKISFTKQTVMNLTFSGFVGAGSVGTGSQSGLSYTGFGGTIGINQKLFFTRNLGLKIELNAMIYERTDVVVVPPTKSMYTNTAATVGMVYLFPTLD